MLTSLPDSIETRSDLVKLVLYVLLAYLELLVSRARCKADCIEQIHRVES